MIKDDFIMSPKVDFAFKEIMFNDKVRKGFLSAVLGIPVSKIKKTVLKNTNLQKSSRRRKTGNFRRLSCNERRYKD